MTTPVSTKVMEAMLAEFLTMLDRPVGISVMATGMLHAADRNWAQNNHAADPALVRCLAATNTPAPPRVDWKTQTITENPDAAVRNPVDWVALAVEAACSLPLLEWLVGEQPVSDRAFECVFQSCSAGALDMLPLLLSGRRRCPPDVVVVLHRASHVWFDVRGAVRLFKAAGLRFVFHVDAWCMCVAQWAGRGDSDLDFAAPLLQPPHPGQARCRTSSSNVVADGNCLLSVHYSSFSVTQDFVTWMREKLKAVGYLVACDTTE